MYRRRRMGSRWRGAERTVAEGSRHERVSATSDSDLTELPRNRPIGFVPRVAPEWLVARRLIRHRCVRSAPRNGDTAGQPIASTVGVAGVASWRDGPGRERDAVRIAEYRDPSVSAGAKADGAERAHGC